MVAPGFVAHQAHSMGAVHGLTSSTAAPQAPFAGVEVDVEAGGGTRPGVVLAGLLGRDGQGVVVTYDAVSSRVAVEVRTGGRAEVVRRARADLVAPYTLGFVLCENRVTVLARRDGDQDRWRVLASEREKVRRLIDLRDPGTLARLVYTWGAETGEVVLGDVRAGLFGMAGLRDPHLVQHADGSPYLRGRTAFLTFTSAGMGGFPEAHMGVFALDLDDPTGVEQVAQLFTARDGLVLGDHAGALVRDGDEWLLATSSWGDFAPTVEGRGVHVRHVRTRADLLRGTHLLATDRAPLPTRLSSWDPGMVRIDGRWHVSYVESASQRPFRFHPALATGRAVPASGSTWTADLRRAGAASELRRCEGPLLTRVGGRWLLVASDGERRVYPVFDLEMRHVGELDAPYPTNIPHPQLVALPEGGYLMVTFDGTNLAPKLLGYGGHGDVLVMTTS